MAKDNFPTRPNVKVTPPGPKAKAIVAKDEHFMATTTKSLPLAIARGHGCIIEDVDGNFLLDFTAGVGVLNTGHTHPTVVAAVGGWVMTQSARRRATPMNASERPRSKASSNSERDRNIPAAAKVEGHDTS